MGVAGTSVAARRPPAFSTCWNSHRHFRGDQMLEEILALGFTRIEISHGTSIALLGEAAEFLRDQPIATSLHNFCPQPLEALRAGPDVFACTSPRSAQRQRALRLTLETIDWAQRLRAKRVVLHLGSVGEPGATEYLIGRARAGKLLDRRFVRHKLRAVERRAKIDRTSEILAWLAPIREHAKQAGVQLGIEIRTGLETFPSPQEFRSIWQDAANDDLGYWHDFGHAQIRDYLRLLDHAAWLQEMTPRVVGAHVHDTHFPDVDHRTPFSGDIDFTHLIGLLPPSVPCVWELSPRMAPQEISVALRRWNECFNSDAEPTA